MNAISHNPFERRRVMERAARNKRMTYIAERASNGASLTEIAGELGVTQQNVSRLWKRIRDQLGWQAQ